MTPVASSEVPDITGIATRNSSSHHHHHQREILNTNETADKDAGKLAHCDLREDDDDDDDDDAVMLLNDICKIRALGTIQRQTTVSSSVSSGTATRTGRQLSYDDVSSRPGSYSVSPGTNNTTTQSNTTLDDISISGSSDSDAESAKSVTGTGNLISRSETQETYPSLCVAQSITDAMIATEHEMIYQRVMENVAANAVVASVVDVDDNNANADGRPFQFVNADISGGTSESLWRHKYYRSRQCQCIALITFVGIGIMVTMGVLLVVQPRRTNAKSMNGSDRINGPLSTLTTFPSSAPTTSIKRDDSVCYTTQELYEAVDAYLVALNTSMAPETSDVAIRYGYPMNAWNVSLLTNFTRVFDPVRDVQITPFDEPHLYPSNMSYFNEDLSQWDVSNADTMYGMFAYAIGFQGVGIDNWDTSSVQDMAYMFYYADAFNNTDIGKWNTARVTSMYGAFFSATSFSGDISTWDVSSVASISHMFGYAVNFPGSNLGLWDVSNVLEMNAVFTAAESFNANLSGWNTSKVETMSNLFSDAYSFDGDLSSWSVGNVVDMDYMLSKTSLSGHWDLSKWDTSRVTTMIGIFSGAKSFAGNVSTWDISNVEFMEGAFSGCTSFNGDLSQWDTGRVQSMENLFIRQFVRVEHKQCCVYANDAKAFNSDISRWDMSAVKDVTRMFSEAELFNESLCEWRNSLPSTCEVTNMFESSACMDETDPILANPMNTSFCTPC